MANTCTLKTITSILLALALASPLWSLGGDSQAAEKQRAPQDQASATITDILLAYKLDPRLAGPTYGGERWVSPPVFMGASAQDTVDVKVLGIDAKGRSIHINPEWMPSDPEMVTVSHSPGDQVRITVHRAGESKLQVSTKSFSKELAIKAEYKNKFLLVQITPVERRPAEAPAAQGAPAPKTADAAAPDSSAFKSQKEKLSYGLGMNLGNALRKQSVEVDLDLIVQGLKDAHSGSKTLMTEQEVRAALTETQSELRQKQIGGKKELAEKNKKEGEAFLAENKKKEGVVTLPSGLQYKILNPSDGKKPSAADAVTCNYRGTLIDGTEFDSSYKRKRPATFAVNGVIQGWNEALQLMPVGSKWQLFIPPELGYGERGSPKKIIGPNTTLIFEVELLSVKDNVGAGAQRAQAAENADDAITANGLKLESAEVSQ
jgi:FKBP-type peptidyl-prolyl cis-trans isomerase FklB